MNGIAFRISEKRVEDLLLDLLSTQGWSVSRPPKGNLLTQNEYRNNEILKKVFSTASKSGEGPGIPDYTLVNNNFQPLAVIEVKTGIRKLDLAIKEATENYGNACIEYDYNVLAIALAGDDEENYALRVLKFNHDRWSFVTYDNNPISWIPNPIDVNSIISSTSLDIKPSIPNELVLAQKADEINRLLRESGIKDEFRPSVIAAFMLGLWNAKGNIRKDKDYILEDINNACKKAFWKAKKPELAESLRVDEANEDLSLKARLIINILEKLNITVLTAEHDYLGQLYETFFR